MDVTVFRTRNTPFSRQKIVEIVDFFSTTVMGKRLSRNIHTEVKFDDIGDCDGFCCPLDDNYRPREFEVLIHRSLGEEQIIKSLAHEVVHIKQYARGEFRECQTGVFMWKGKKTVVLDYKKEYHSLPWEQEALLSEDLLLGLYRKKCGVDHW